MALGLSGSNGGVGRERKRYFVKNENRKLNLTFNKTQLKKEK